VAAPISCREEALQFSPVWGQRDVEHFPNSSLRDAHRGWGLLHGFGYPSHETLENEIGFKILGFLEIPARKSHYLFLIGLRRPNDSRDPAITHHQDTVGDAE